MDIKPIALQMAVHRTPDAGVIQQQLLQKPMLDQAALATQIAKENDEKRKKSLQVEDLENADIVDSEQEQASSYQSKKKKKPPSKSISDNDLERSAHPYKGQHIDFIL